MGLTNLLRDLPIYLAPASIAQLLTVTRYRHPQHPRYSTPLRKIDFWPESFPFEEPSDLPFEIEAERDRLASLDNDRWEYYLDPWVRRIEPIALGYLHPGIRREMNRAGLTELLDERCRERGWPEYAVTGSNISAVSAGKAAWALLRWSSGQEWGREKYHRSLNRTHWYIERAISEKGTPHEGLLYGLFGLKAVGVLSRLQRYAGERTVIASRYHRLKRLAKYVERSAVEVGKFHHHGDSKTVDLDGSFLSYLYHTEGVGVAGRALYLIGESNARVPYYSRLYKIPETASQTEYDSLPQPLLWSKDLYVDREVGQVIYREPFDHTLHVVDAGGGFPAHRLHLGVKPGSRSLWRRNRWLVRDDLYTNALRNWRDYTPAVFTAPRRASLLERAEITEVNEKHVRLDGFGWSVTYPHRKI